MKDGFALVYLRGGIERIPLGDACYRSHCIVLHQGSSILPDSPCAKAIFIEPGAENYGIHYCLIKNEAPLIQLDEFVKEVLTGHEKWPVSVKDTRSFETNVSRFATPHPNGLSPFIHGVPVVG